MSTDWVEAFCAFCQGNLTDEVKETYHGRGVSEAQLTSYRLGYLSAPPPDFPVVYQWATEKRLSDALVLPLTTFGGRIRGFQFRTREYKRYLDLKVIPWGPDLFGAHQAAPLAYDTATLFLVEGVFDLFPLARLYPNAVATLTARVSQNLVRTVSRFCTRIVILYDKDETGQRATQEAVRRWGRTLTVDSVTLPQVAYEGARWVKDLGELWEVWGDTRLHEYLQPRCT